MEGAQEQVRERAPLIQGESLSSGRSLGQGSGTRAPERREVLAVTRSRNSGAGAAGMAAGLGAAAPPGPESAEGPGTPKRPSGPTTPRRPYKPFAASRSAGAFRTRRRPPADRPPGGHSAHTGSPRNRPRFEKPGHVAPHLLEEPQDRLLPRGSAPLPSNTKAPQRTSSGRVLSLLISSNDGPCPPVAAGGRRVGFGRPCRPSAGATTPPPAAAWRCSSTGAVPGEAAWARPGRECQAQTYQQEA